MSYDLYWFHSDPGLFWAYFEAHRLELESKKKYDNQLSWLSGLYVYNAIGTSLGGKEYPAPIDFEEMERIALLTEEEKLKEEQQKAEMTSKSQMMNIMAQLKQKKGGG